MILVYLALLALLLAAAWLAGRRANRLERKWARCQSAVLDAVGERQARGAATKCPDPLDGVRDLEHGFRLWGLVRRRDRLEAGWHRWEGLRGWARGLAATLLRWRGKAAPYVLGAADAVAAVGLIQAAGIVWDLDLDAVQKFFASLTW